MSSAKPQPQHMLCSFASYGLVCLDCMRLIICHPHRLHTVLLSPELLA